MKKIVLLFLSSSISFAIQWQVIGQDSKLPVHQGSFQADLKQSVGEATIALLKENQIPFIGESYGMNSILNTPTGDKALVVESDTQMRAYGWCYTVDGVDPDVTPDKYFFASQDSTLTWFFAYALYEDGVWKSYCTPAYLKPLR